MNKKKEVVGRDEVSEIQDLFENRLKVVGQKIKAMGELFAGLGHSDMTFNNDHFFGLGYTFDGFGSELDRIADDGFKLCCSLRDTVNAAGQEVSHE